jgi:hypothetical protein
VLSTLEMAGFRDLPSTVSGTLVTAPVSQLGAFAARHVAGAPAKVDCATAKPPCGGTLTGSWRPASGCGLSRLQLASCPGSTTVFDDQLAGSLTFGDTGSYAATITFVETFTGHLSPACLSANGATDCAAAQAKLRSSGNSSRNPSLVNALCTGDPTVGCDCTGTGSGTIASGDRGTYAAAGTSFTVTRGGVAGSPSGYCVDGTTLWLQTSATATLGFVR